MSSEEKKKTEPGKTAPPVQARSLSKWYGQVAGLLNVDLEIRDGVVGLLGPNGAGKTTFMRILTSQLRESSGSMLIFGEPVFGNAKALRYLGYCPEHDGMWEEMTGLEFVTFCVRLSGRPKHKAKKLAENAIEKVDMMESSNRRLKTYSKGMRQRIKIAQAIAHNPGILVLDEPLTGCDPVARASIIKLVREMGRTGATVLVSSHVLHEVEAMTDQIVLISKGQVLAQGGIHDLRELIDEHPHRIHLLCEKPRKLASELAKLSSVQSLEFIEGGIRVQTPQPDNCYTDLIRLILENEIKISEMSSPDDNLDAVFRYLVSGKQKAKEA